MEKIPSQTIGSKIYVIRGVRVMLDNDLAALYGVPAKRLNESVKRNRRRFPDDFMFRLSHDEYDSLRSRMATLKPGRGKHRKYLPFAFSEQGVAMLSSILDSDRAVSVNIQIMRAFVRMREMITTNSDFTRRLTDLEKRFESQDVKFKAVFEAIRQLGTPALPQQRRKIGFRW